MFFQVMSYPYPFAHQPGYASMPSTPTTPFQWDSEGHQPHPQAQQQDFQHHHQTHHQHHAHHQPQHDFSPQALQTIRLEEEPFPIVPSQAHLAQGHGYASNATGASRDDDPLRTLMLAPISEHASMALGSTSASGEELSLRPHVAVDTTRFSHHHPHPSERPNTADTSPSSGGTGSGRTTPVTGPMRTDVVAHRDPRRAVHPYRRPQSAAGISGGSATRVPSGSGGSGGASSARASGTLGISGLMTSSPLSSSGDARGGGAGPMGTGARARSEQRQHVRVSGDSLTASTSTSASEPSYTAGGAAGKAGGASSGAMSAPASHGGASSASTPSHQVSASATVSPASARGGRATLPSEGGAQGVQRAVLLALRMDLHYNPETHRMTAMLEAPGLRRSDVSIVLSTAVNSLRQVVVAGRARPVLPDLGYTVRERKYGDFKRTIPVPNHVQLQDISARVADGIITVEIDCGPPVDQTTQEVEIQS